MLSKDVQSGWQLPSLPGFLKHRYFQVPATNVANRVIVYGLAPIPASHLEKLPLRRKLGYWSPSCHSWHKDIRWSTRWSSELGHGWLKETKFPWIGHYHHWHAALSSHQGIKETHLLLLGCWGHLILTEFWGSTSPSCFPIVRVGRQPFKSLSSGFVGVLITFSFLVMLMYLIPLLEWIL